MLEQFFGKQFWIGLTSIFIVFGGAVFSYTYGFSIVIVIILALFVAFLAAKHPFIGLTAVFLELFSNPHGHLIPFLRIAVFIGFFIGYIIFLLRTKSLPHIPISSSVFLFPFLLAILIGFITGLILNDPFTAFKDGNAYFYILYAIPVLGHRYTAKDQRIFLQILCAGAIWNILATFGILYLFTHFDESLLRTSYVFLRNVRFSEITNVGAGFYRIFIQSQFFAFVFGAILMASIFNQKNKLNSLYTGNFLGAILAIFLLSLSRSFWIGAVMAFFIFIVLLLRSKKDRRVWKTASVLIGISVLTSITLIAIISLFPFPQQRLRAGDLAEAFSKRTEMDVAISSRWQLLEPMKKKIRENPILGSGFGTHVSFVTDDPRIREIYPDGVWSTYAMEWGWFELWLKMGILGPIGFLILFVYLVRQLLLYLKTDREWLGIGLITGLIFLYVTHFFSPYLNHPIGLGFIIFIFLFLPDKTQPITISAHFPKFAHIPKEMPEPSSALSLRVERK